MAKTIEINNLQEPTPATKKQKWNKESKILMEYHNYKGDHTHRYPLHATNKIMLSEAEVEDKILTSQLHCWHCSVKKPLIHLQNLVLYRNKQRTL